MSSYLLLCSKLPQSVEASNNHSLLFLTTLWTGWAHELTSCVTELEGWLGATRGRASRMLGPFSQRLRQAEIPHMMAEML